MPLAAVSSVTDNELVASVIGVSFPLMTATLKSGVTEEWMLEGGTPNTLLRAGLTNQILLPGTEILVRGYQSKDPDCIPKCRGSGRDITLPNGDNVFMGSSGVGAPPGGFPDDN